MTYAYLSVDAARTVHPFASPGLPKRTVLSAEGCYAHDENGPYFDGISGLYNVNIGYGRKDLASLLSTASQRLSFAHIYADAAGNAVTNEAAEQLSVHLTSIVPSGRAVIYSTAGAEANDTALKVVLAYWAARGKPERKRFISRLSSFHGCGGLSAEVTGNPALHTYFNQFSPTIFLSRPEKSMSAEILAAELEATINREGAETIAAFIAEPIIGAGGVYDPPEGYFPAVQRVLKAYGILTIADEVVTGYGRIGDWLASTALGFEPDIVTMSKGLTAGYWPLSATILTAPVAEALSGVEGPFPHGYTMAGHPVGCAVACRVGEILIDEQIFENVRAKGPALKAALQELADDHPYISRVRGDGFLLSLELKDRASDRLLGGNVGLQLVRRALQDHRLMLRGNPHALIIAPPLIATGEHLDWLIDAIRRVTDVHHFHG